MARRAQPVATFSDPLLLQVANVPLIIHEIQVSLGLHGATASRNCTVRLHKCHAEIDFYAGGNDHRRIFGRPCRNVYS
jgi:hypothetical protein